MRVVQENGKIRLGLFEGQCDQCQSRDEVDNVDNSGSKVLVCSKDGFQTPSSNPCQPQLEGSLEPPGQWTLVANRKKSKSKLEG
jgi:hypothetical protein